MADGVAVGWFLHSGKQKGEMLPEEHADFLGHDDQNRSDSRPTASLGLITHILAGWLTGWLAGWPTGRLNALFEACVTEISICSHSG